MRALLPVGILAALAFSGCLKNDNDGGGGTTPIVAPTLNGYAPDCSVDNWVDTCIAWTSPNASPSKTEIDLVANPKDSANVVVSSKDLDRQASNCVWAVPHWTKDAGRNWTTNYIGGKKSERQPGQPLYGWDCITDPIMAFDYKGVLYYSLQVYNFQSGGPNADPAGALSNQGSNMMMARSKDGGKTWDKIITLLPGDGTAIFPDYMRMTVSPKSGAVFTTWDQFTTTGGVPTPVCPPVNQIPCGFAVVPLVIASRDGGETADKPVYVPVPDEAGQVTESGLVAATDGTLYLMLHGNSEAYLSTSTDDGMTFSTPTKVFSFKPINSPLPHTQFRVGSFPELAIDNSDGPHKGCLYSAWIDNATGDPDVLASRSCDKGAHWTKPVRINKDNTTNAQFMVRLTVSADGVVHVGYMTRAYDPNDVLIDAEYANSADGGETWVTHRLTTQSWDGDKGVHQGGFPFFGDYIGIAASGPDVYVGFPDCVTGVCEVAVAHLSKTL